jgi:hypothetical protein
MRVIHQGPGSDRIPSGDRHAAVSRLLKLKPECFNVKAINRSRNRAAGFDDQYLSGITSSRITATEVNMEQADQHHRKWFNSFRHVQRLY